MNLRSILGQDRALRILKVFLENRRIPPALLFTGPRGVGKSLAARAFAEALQCADSEIDACGTCASCLAASKGLDGDIHRVDADYQASLAEEETSKQTSIKVGTVRHLLRDLEMRAAPGRWKVAIIEEAHRLVTHAANAMLKCLEEPPPRTVWILVTHRPAELLTTVRSRCQSVAFSPLMPEVLTRMLVERGFDADAAGKAAHRAEGSLSRALAMLEDPLPDPSTWIKDPMAPISLAEKLPKELHLSRPLVGEHLHQMAWYLRRNRGIAGYAVPAVRIVQRELAEMHEALAANADPRLILEISALRLQQLDGALK